MKGTKASVEMPLYFVDVSTDIVTCALLYSHGHVSYASVMLLIILTSWCSGYAVFLAYAHYRFRFSSISLTAAFFLGMPLGTILALYLDICMPVFAAFREPLFKRAERLGTDSMVQEFATFMSSYTVVRQVVEVTTESLPQVMLQLYIYNNIGEEGLSMPLRALAFSIIVSLANLVLTWGPITYNIRYKYAGEGLAYLLSELSGGARIPLSELEHKEPETVSMSFGARGPSRGEVVILRELITRNVVTKNFVVHAVPLPLRELIFDEEAVLLDANLLDMEHAVFVARVLAHNKRAKRLLLRFVVEPERFPAVVGVGEEASDVLDLEYLLAEPHVALTSAGLTNSHLLLLTGLLLERGHLLRDAKTSLDGLALPMHELLSERLVQVQSDLGNGKRLGSVHALVLVALLTSKVAKARHLVLDGTPLDVPRLAASSVLDLSSAKLRDPHTIVLAQAVRLNRSLKKLVLWGNHITDTAMTVLLRELDKCATLQYLDLSWNPLGLDSVRELAALLVDNATLETLILYGVSVKPAGARMLSEALKRNSTLRSLVLFSNELGDMGAAHLAEGLKRNTTLTEVGLGHNQIGEEGGKLLAAALRVNADAVHEQGELTVRGAEQIRDVFSRIGGVAVGAFFAHGSIRLLSLGGNRLGDEAAAAFADVLVKDPSLVELHLAGNFIGDRGGAALAAALETNTNLKTLDLRGNYGLGEVSQEALCKAWGQRSEYLSLQEDGDSEIDDRSVRTMQSEV